jgi:exopolysaccharide biosynthesis protein
MADLWKRREIRDGLVWYNLEGLERITLRSQVVNVLEMDLDSETMKLEFLYYPEREVISEVSKQNADIIALTNASYGSGFSGSTPVDNTYIRVDGVNYKEISIGPEDGGNWWKHEAAVWYDGESQLGFINKAGDPAGVIEYYKSTTYKNLFSSNAMLVENHRKSDLAAYSRKFTSSAREPRTVLAVTADRKLLLMTVDGRWSDKAAGMSYTELQNVLQAYFNPSNAINMDGGGSTGMYIKGKGRNSTDVVNYPCEGNSDYKVYGGTTKERPLITYFAIREK